MNPESDLQVCEFCTEFGGNHCSNCGECHGELEIEYCSQGEHCVHCCDCEGGHGGE